MGKHTQSIDRRILARIRARGKARVFTPADFLDLGTRASVDQALSRNTRAGILRKVGRGLYDLPRNHPLFGRLSTTTDAVAKAVAKRDKATLHTSGAHAANILGLSDQVPMKLVYLTDGRKRHIQVGKSPIIFKHTTARTVKTKNPASAGGCQEAAHGTETTRPGGIIRKEDVSIAKNYLEAGELGVLNRIVTVYLEFAELQALRRKVMTMREWIAKLDEFLKLSDHELLDHAGKISAEQARAKAELEYDRYRKILDAQPRPVDADFEKAVAKLSQSPSAKKIKPPKP